MDKAIWHAVGIIVLFLIVTVSGCRDAKDRKLSATEQKGQTEPRLSMRNAPRNYVKGKIVPIAQCNTVDSSADSDGFLKCMKKVIGRPPTGQTNKNVNEALGNLSSCSNTSSDTAMIIGHGRSGVVHTGAGDYNGKSDQYISDLDSEGWNLSDISQSVQEALNHRFKTLIIFGCDSGSEKEGARLLNDMRSLTSSKVMASTYTVWCGDDGTLWLDEKATWNTADQGQPAAEIAKPQADDKEFGHSPFFLSLLTDTGDVDSISKGSVVDVQLCALAMPRRRDADRCWHIKDLESFVRAGYFSDPFQPNAIPGAVRTGSITISSNGRPSITFNILNDELIADVKHQTYYHVSKQFSESWARLE